MYLEQLAEVGLLGFLMFAAILGTVVRQLREVWRRTRVSDSNLAYLAAGMQLAILCYLVDAVFLHLSYQRYYWLLLALGGAVYQIYQSEGQAAASAAPAHPA